MTQPRAKIVLDAMGSDTHPDPEIEAAVTAAAEQNVEVFLVGPQDILQPRLEGMGITALPLHVVHAPDVLGIHDKPSEYSRKKAGNSMAVGLGLVKDGQADAFVTVGNTGGAMASALFQLGRISGVKRPGLTAVFPSKDGQVVVLDIGANTDCKALYLLQFAVMGSVYANHVLGIERPRVGLLSNGEEPGKGSLLIQETYPLLKSSSLNFIGNVEAKELFGGEVDVVVADGFAGNVLLKSSEAATKLLVDTLRAEIMSSTRSKVGAALARPAFDRIRKMLDPGEIGAAPLLGVNGLVFIGHGRSDARAVVNAIKTTTVSVNADLLGWLRKSLSEELETVSNAS
ncbi:MAG: phosphate acyltransferase PlsX [Anaerolineales bacterium]|nr:phosphate acyltransferase PlsX [Anaerolineales bacterium]